MEKKIRDEEFGEMTVRYSDRARRYSIRFHDGQLILVIPLGGNLLYMLKVLESHREQVRKAILKSPKEPEQHKAEPKELHALLLRAVKELPPRIEYLAKLHGFHYNGLRINNAHTRWGSCNAKRSINLSLSLVTLPQHLIDYVILHELCHTVEMNHGPRFWALLDSVTDNRAKALRKEMKAFHTVI